jgi:amino acid permease
MEYSSVIEHYWGRRWKMVIDILLNLTLQAYNIASIVICAQAVDQFFIYVAGRTWALEISPHFLHWETFDKIDVRHFTCQEMM